MEISEKYLAELLSMARKPQRDKTKCIHCDNPIETRGLCCEHWKVFRRDKKRQAARVKTLAEKEKRDKLTLLDKKRNAMEKWDRLQVRLGLVLDSKRGRHPGTNIESPFTKTA